MPAVDKSKLVDQNVRQYEFRSELGVLVDYVLGIQPAGFTAATIEQVRAGTAGTAYLPASVLETWLTEDILADTVSLDPITDKLDPDVIPVLDMGTF